jgi:nicotinamidase-related amidase
MPITGPDISCALVLIDLQVGVTSLLAADVLEPVVARAAALAAAFRDRELPVILVRTDFSADWADAPRNRTGAPRPSARPPANWAEILPDLGAQPADVVVTKRQPGAFYGTDLDLQLRRRGATQIVLGGIATSLGVESTGRAAYDHGYNVAFAADAMADFNAASHDHSVGAVFPYFGEVDTAAAIEIALKK